ncbi:MAG: EF-hand domain-containing protein [Bacillota bacterium]
MNKSRAMLLTWSMAMLASSTSFSAEQSSINPRVGSAGFANVVFGGQTASSDSNDIVFNISHKCFGTNLRNVSNPVSPLSEITIKIHAVDNGAPKDIELKYPATILLDAGPSVDVVNNGGYSSMVVQSAVNTIRVAIPSDLKVTTDSNGSVVVGSKFAIQSIQFSQVVDPIANAQFAVRCPKCHINGNPADYIAKTGPLAATVRKSISRDMKTYDIKVDIPGQVGFCDGYYSPLMVFFDDKRPQFTAEVDFPLSPLSKSYWPEKGSSGAFIVYDANNDGKITTSNELFGNSAGVENGFEALRKFDSNSDGVIDEKDAEFKKLKLWYDNGDGISTAKELIPLYKKIKSISLKYDGSTTYAVGERAEAKQFSTFKYIRKGKVHEGTVVDYWFAPVKGKILTQK